MIEITRLLMEGIKQILAGLSSMSSRKRKQRINDIGGRLFVIYFRLNEVIITAENIIGCLEAYVQRMGNYLADGKDSHALTAGKWIKFDLAKQVVNLGRVGHLMADMDHELMLVAGGTYVNLDPLLDRKLGALKTLTYALESGHLPIPSESDLDVLANAMADREGRIWESISLEWRLATDLGSTAISTTAPWDEPIYQMVKSYLEHGRPRQELEQIRATVTEFRTALIRYFSVEDMLLAVGDRRIDAGQRWPW
jgi:hypothetical protein